MKKCILKLDLNDDRDKRKALKIVSTLSGIDAVAMNMKDKTLTVVGSVDPVNVVSKLRKFWPTTNIIFVGPAKEPEKKEEGKKEEGKKDEGKKDEGKKDEEKKEDGKKDDGKKKEDGKEEEKKKVPAGMPIMQMPMQMPMAMPMPYRPAYYPPINTYQQNYHPYQQHNYQPLHHTYQPRHHSIEENPNACIIS